MTLLRHRVLLHPCHRRLGLKARDHQSYQLLIEALRETPFWDRYFTIVDLLVGVENGYARNYDLDAAATVNV
ncbi:darcynin family protein [Actinoplanes ianthinogenes]|uniref:darcynin family protein n=1 Tax=Actinoplanes ianthinogenes TaxID=122358 RepID=UPI001BB391A5